MIVIQSTIGMNASSCIAAAHWARLKPSKSATFNLLLLQAAVQLD